MPQSMDFYGDIAEEEKRLPNLEHMLGKTLMQPFAASNSGVRKLMYEIQLEHSLALEKPEVPIIQTGYEIRFGDHSSSIITAENDMEIIDKVFKFEKDPNRHYYLITRDLNTGEFSYIERKEYTHTTETYGYLYNNHVLDMLEPGHEVKEGEIIRTSCAFDEYMNRCDGVNLLTGYISSDKTMEDGIMISKSAAKKLNSPLVKEVRVLVNDNDLLLNVFGDDTTYKSFPDIGEKIQGSILCAVRREKTEESLYMQSIDRLNVVLMSDDKFTVEGKVVDISIYCNNPDTLMDKYSNCQVAHYYNEHRRFNKDLIESIEKIKQVYGKTALIDPHLNELYYDAVREEQGGQFILDKPFSGTTIVFYILDINTPDIGDKITNRYGGKGVISKILDDELMPMIEETGEHLDICFNSSTCVNRLNPGQLMETSLTFIGSRILEYILESNISVDESIDMVYRYLKHISMDEANEFLKLMYDEDGFDRSEEDRAWYMSEMINDGYIIVSNLPITEGMTIDKLNDIYKEFPFIKQYNIQSMIKDSNGNYRPIKGRRPLVCGKMYIYRLKQYAEEKFSVTSLSSTNIRNENTRNKANKNYKALHTSTPIRFGEMETEDFMHMGAEYVISNLMIHSVSPQARRLVESALTGNPYHVDIVLDSESRNRNVEILNAYLKTMGLKLTFKKKKKKFTHLMCEPLMNKIKVPKESVPLMRKLSDNQINTKVFGKDRVEWIIENIDKSKSYLMTEPLMREDELKGITDTLSLPKTSKE